MSSGGGAYLVATQKTLSLELGTPRRLRQFFTTVILNPAAINMGLMVVCQTGLALLVQTLCVFSITNASGSSLHAILAQATATWARMSPCLCSPALEKHWQGGDAQMTSSPVGAELQMRSTSVGWSRSALINGESNLMVWYLFLYRAADVHAQDDLPSTSPYCHVPSASSGAQIQHSDLSVARCCAGLGCRLGLRGVVACTALGR